MDNRSLNAYLKTIYVLEETKTAASTANIAKALDITPASVSEMLQKLAKENYVSYSPYHGVQLTVKGKEIATKAVRKHRLLEAFLKNTLKLKDNNEVRRQAGELVHSLSDKADQQLCIFLSRPKEDPVDRGEIPHCTKRITCEECLKENHGKVGKPSF